MQLLSPLEYNWILVLHIIALICESFALIRESFALFREKYFFYTKMSSMGFRSTEYKFTRVVQVLKLWNDSLNQVQVL